MPGTPLTTATSSGPKRLVGTFAFPGEPLQKRLRGKTCFAAAFTDANEQPTTVPMETTSASSACQPQPTHIDPANEETQAQTNDDEIMDCENDLDADEEAAKFLDQ